MLIAGFTAAGDGFLVGHLRRVVGHRNVAAVLDVLKGDFEVHVAHAPKNEFVGLGVVVELGGGILFRGAVQRHADLVSVGFILRLDGVGGDGGGENDRLELNAASGGAE